MSYSMHQVRTCDDLGFTGIAHVGKLYTWNSCIRCNHGRIIYSTCTLW